MLESAIVRVRMHLEYMPAVCMRVCVCVDRTLVCVCARACLCLRVRTLVPEHTYVSKYVEAGVHQTCKLTHDMCTSSM